MPAPPPVYLQGGPCNGTIRKLTGAEQSSGRLTCKGATYKREGTGATRNGLYVWGYQAPVSSGGGSQSLRGPQALRGWKSLRKSVNRGYPQTLAYMAHGSSAALRSLHRARKVRL